MECLCHLILVDEFETATISIPNPYESDSIINLFIHAKKDPKISVNLINGTPYINCDITLSADILSLDSNSDYSTKESYTLINNYVEGCYCWRCYDEKSWVSSCNHYCDYYIVLFSSRYYWMDIRR